MPSLRDQIRDWMRASLGSTLKESLNRLRVRDPQGELKDPLRGPVLGSRGQGGGFTTVVPDVPVPELATFFGIPFSDDAPTGWGEPLEPAPGTPGGTHPERLWKLDQGTWTVANQLDWESTHPAGWKCGTISWTSASGVTISWNWRPAGGHERSGACKYVGQVPGFVDWIAGEQIAQNTIQSEIYCNGRLVLQMPSLAGAPAGVIGAAILGDYLLIAAIVVRNYGSGNEFLMYPDRNRTYLGYWPIQTHSDGGIEIVPASEFQVLETIQDYRWTQQWTFSQDGTQCACIANDTLTATPWFEDTSGRTIWRGAWSLGPLPGVVVSSEVDAGGERENYYLDSSGIQYTDNCIVSPFPDINDLTYTDGPVTNDYCQLSTYPNGMGVTKDRHYKSGSGPVSGNGVHDVTFTATPSESRHVIAVDFIGNTESLAEAVFTCVSSLSQENNGFDSSYQEEIEQTTSTYIGAGGQCIAGCWSCFSAGGPGLNRVVFKDAWVNATITVDVKMKLALEIGSQERVILGEVDEAFSWDYDGDAYYRRREWQFPTLPDVFDSPAKFLEADPVAEVEKWYSSSDGDAIVIEDTEIGTFTSFSCPDAANIDLPEVRSWVSNSTGLSMNRLKGKLLWMDIARDLYITYEERGDFYHDAGWRNNGIDPWDSPIWQESSGEDTDDRVTITRDGNVLEQPEGTPAPGRRMLLDGKPRNDSFLWTGILLNDHLALGDVDIGAVRGEGDAVLLAVLHDWRLVSDGELRLTKLYTPDADPMTLVSATGTDQFIGGIGRAG